MCNEGNATCIPWSNRECSGMPGRGEREIGCGGKGEVEMEAVHCKGNRRGERLTGHGSQRTDAGKKRSVTPWYARVAPPPPHGHRCASLPVAPYRGEWEENSWAGATIGSRKEERGTPYGSAAHACAHAKSRCRAGNEVFGRSSDVAPHCTLMPQARPPPLAHRKRLTSPLPLPNRHPAHHSQGPSLPAVL